MNKHEFLSHLGKIIEMEMNERGKAELEYTQNLMNSEKNTKEKKKKYTHTKNGNM
jgi:hypothetical protein